MRGAVSGARVVAGSLGIRGKAPEAVENGEEAVLSGGCHVGDQAVRRLLGPGLWERWLPTSSLVESDVGYGNREASLDWRQRIGLLNSSLCGVVVEDSKFLVKNIAVIGRKAQPLER